MIASAYALVKNARRTAQAIIGFSFSIHGEAVLAQPRCDNRTLAFVRGRDRNSSVCLFSIRDIRATNEVLMNNHTPGPRGRTVTISLPWLLAGVALLLVMGSINVVLFLRLQQPAPSKPAGAASVSPSASPIPSSSSQSTPTPISQDTSIQNVAWSPGATIFAVATANGTISVWQTANTMRWQKNLGTKIWSIAWSPDGAGAQRIVVAGGDGKVRMLDALSGDQLLVYTGHGSTSVLSIAWSANPYTPLAIASGDSDGIIHVWDPSTGKTISTMQQAAPVKGLAFGGA
jgi:WD40 repeat protein